MRILLVEDEHDLADWLVRALSRHAGYIVDWVNDGLVAQRRLHIEKYDAIILDLGLPGLSGRGLLRSLREQHNRTPVLVLTARDSLGNRVDLLNEGADDFIAKPFKLEELKARLEAVFRRTQNQGDLIYTCASLRFDPESQRFDVNGHPLALSPREHSVLRILIQRSGQAVSKQAIVDRLVDMDSDLTPEAVEVLIHRLRKKLQTVDAHIVTLRGLGYCLEAIP